MGGAAKSPGARREGRIRLALSGFGVQRSGSEDLESGPWSREFGTAENSELRNCVAARRLRQQPGPENIRLAALTGCILGFGVRTWRQGQQEVKRKQDGAKPPKVNRPQRRRADVPGAVSERHLARYLHKSKLYGRDKEASAETPQT